MKELNISQVIDEEDSRQLDPIPIDFHIFQRGGPTTKQHKMVKTMVLAADLSGAQGRQGSQGT